MAERLAALGLKPPMKSSESSRQDSGHDNERTNRLQQAEEEDSRRESERHRRLADEEPTPPEPSKAIKKPPPAPPVRKARADSGAQRAGSKKKDDLAPESKAEQEGMEKAIKDQQAAQASETKAMAYVKPSSTFRCRDPNNTRVVMRPNVKQTTWRRSVMLHRRG